MLDKISARLANLWNDAKAAAMSEPELLLYRSNLLGSDKRITNYGGGNTSAKVIEKDPLTGEAVEVLWVKGSGGDVGTMKLDGFATLYQAKLEGLKKLYRGVEHEDEMVGYLPHCTFNLNPRAASIDTPLHAFVPRKHVDHMHPDAVIAIAAAKNSKELTAKIFGGEIGWLPWKRPGFELGLWLEKFCRENPEATGVVLESHGLFTWGDTAKESYETTIRIINRAIEWFEGEAKGKPAFGGEVRNALPAAERRAIAARLMPAIRGMISARRAQGRPLRRPAGGAGVRRLEGSREARRTRHQLPRPFPAHQDPAAGGRLRSGESRSRQDARRAGRRRSRTTARATPPITNAASMPTAPPCAIPTPWSTSCPASA